MPKEKSIFDPQRVLPTLENLKKRILEIISKKRKLVAGILVVLLAIFLLNKPNSSKNGVGNAAPARSVSEKVGKSFDYPALSSQGKQTNNKIKFTIASVEKTNQVLVNDKTFTAKNNKLFLIINLELKNDSTQMLNILPGDLIRLTYSGDEENKFAPDLHNNLVPIAAISTKLDRVGFVIPDSIKVFKILVGELEGKKESIEISFPS